MTVLSNYNRVYTALKKIDGLNVYTAPVDNKELVLPFVIVYLEDMTNSVSFTANASVFTQLKATLIVGELIDKNRNEDSKRESTQNLLTRTENITKVTGMTSEENAKIEYTMINNDYAVLSYTKGDI